MSKLLPWKPLLGGVAALMIGATAAVAAPMGTPGTGLVGTGTGLVEKVHGRHCGWRGGHRHQWACKQPRRSVRSYRSHRGYENSERNWPPYRYSAYRDYPFWANKAFTDAQERGGGRR
jgi:hypothetical protein